MLGCIQPMSSPMMKRMLGFAAGAWACAGLRRAGAASKNPAAIARNLTHLRCRAFICHLSVNECDDCLPAHAEGGMIVVGAKSRVESLLTEMPQIGTRRFVATPRAVERGGRRFPEEGPVLAGEPSELPE